MTQRRKSPLFGMVTAAALSLLLVAPTLAADTTTATVTGGSRTITNPAAADFTTASVTGVAQWTWAGVGEFSVSDLTGSGAGWHVTAEATRFAGASHQLANGSLLMNAPTVTADGTTSPNPGITASSFTIDNGPVKIASAALNTGMGKYNFSATPLALSLPADVYADAYVSTVTISVVSAP
jgi:hypothetical protein